MPLPSSDRYLTEIKNSQTMITKVEVVLEGIVVPNISFYVEQGSATEDATNHIRGKCGLTFIDPTGEFVPSKPGDLLYPSTGTEIKISRGIKLSTGEEELKSLGIFGFDEVSIADSGSKVEIGIDGFDRAETVSRARFLDVLTIAKNTNLIAALKQIFGSTVNPDNFNNLVSAFKVSQQTYDRGSDRWVAARELCEAYGLELYFDRDGKLQLEPPPVVTNAPDWTFKENEEATILSLDKSLTRNQYNHVVEIGEGGDITTPFRADAIDKVSVEATGDRPVFHVSSLYTNKSQAQIAANAKLERIKGTIEGLQFQNISNPAICANDTAQVVNSGTKTDSVYIFDKVTVSLRASQSQYITCRERVIA